MPIASEVTAVSVTPTLDTSPYATGDSLHTAVMEFAGVVGDTGGAGFITKLLIIDKDAQSAPGELWLFNATVTPATVNTAHSITDADAAKCIGVIPFGPYYASALNSISVAKPNLPFSVAATSLFAIAVTRGAPTHTAAGLTFTLLVDRD